MEIHLYSEHLTFSAAHFCAHGDWRERLHGHNYQVSVKLGGTVLQPDGYLVDFSVMKTHIKNLCQEFKEYLLVPTQSDHLKVSRQGDQCEIQTQSGFFSVPWSDCRFLPVGVTTVEQMSQYFWHLLHQKMEADPASDPKIRGLSWMEVNLAEKPGQSAAFKKLFESPPDT